MQRETEKCAFSDKDASTEDRFAALLDRVRLHLQDDRFTLEERVSLTLMKMGFDWDYLKHEIRSGGD